MLEDQATGENNSYQYHLGLLGDLSKSTSDPSLSGSE